MRSREARGIETEAGEGGGALRGDEEVGAREELRHRLAPGLGLEVEAADFHAFVEAAIPTRAKGLERIARRRLDLRDGRAEIAQACACRGAWKIQSGGDDAQALQQVHA
jgi:hypothetical protein